MELMRDPWKMDFPTENTLRDIDSITTTAQSFPRRKWPKPTKQLSLTTFFFKNVYVSCDFYLLGLLLYFGSKENIHI